MKNSRILVKTKSKKYPVYIGNNSLNQLPTIIKDKLSNVRKIAIIADRKLPAKLLKKLKSLLKKYNVKVYKLDSKKKNKKY